MIQPQELRIGNYVEYRIQDELDERKEWWELSIIDSSDLQILESGIDDDYRAIPLTEEILLKFGFEEKSKSKNFYLGNFRFHISKPANYNGFIFCDGYDVITDRIKYVHQLQNLYFDLKGKRLMFKNK